MFRSTRLLSSASTLWARFNIRLRVTNENLSFHLFCLVSGFFIGNIFGTFLNALRTIFPWDGFIIVAFVFLCEFISFQTYRPVPRPVRARTGDAERASFFSWRPWNLMKLGVLFGFFVDAFKVGS